MPKQIISKYFCKVMDESLNDFQEKKTKCSGPKLNNKPKPRAKPKKQVKGQKDIRTLIQIKKNELITFTKDFNNVCSKSGIDVDSQELQLAIALSKSLQDQGQVEPGTSQDNTTLTSQERSNQIRRTLQEYGFKVSDTKNKSEANKRVKKYKKPYRLLMTSETERLQKISNKYSRILFQNPDLEECDDSIDSNKGLYYFGTNISYKFMRSNDLFHIPEIVEDISLNKGGLLRNWCDIPGRPCSPVLLNDFPFSISDIDCTQAELDTILSGTLIAAKAIFNSKLDRNSPLEETKSEVKTNQSKDIVCIPLFIKSQDEEPVNETKNICIDKNFTNSEDCTLVTMPSSPHRNRSLSPDIFGDDASSLIENSIIIDAYHTTKKTVNTQIIDLCEPKIRTNLNLAEQTTLLSETSNDTKRISNDFMDLTECVSKTSQKYKSNLLSLSTNVNEGEVIYNDCMEITECIKSLSQKSYVGHSDNVTTASDVTLCTGLQVKGSYSIDKDGVAICDLTQSSNSDEELPMVEIGGTQKSLSCDTIIVDYDNYVNVSSNDSIKEQDKEKLNTYKDDAIGFIEENNVELSTLSTRPYLSVDNGIDTSITVVNENISIIHNHTDVSDIDLTQSSGSSVDLHQSKTVPADNYNNLGKVGDVSIDYDEICVDPAENEHFPDEQLDEIQTKYANDSSNVAMSSKNSTEYSQQQMSNSSNTSKVFDLSDRELNYSMCKSNIENFELGGISIMDNLSNLTGSKHYNSYQTKGTLNRSLSDSCLPSVSFKDNKRIVSSNRQTEKYIKLNESIYSTPIKAVIKDDKISVQTPTNSEYVIKVREVTPMLDYAAMSSPERNKELEKYGLKPFKRKRGENFICL